MGKLATVVVLTKKPSTSISGGSSLDEVGIDPNDAGVIISLFGNLAICQVCNPYKTVRMELPLNCLADTGFVPA